jgi:hypothetical protein
MRYLLDRQGVIDYIATLEKVGASDELLAKANAMLNNPQITEPEK